MALRLLASRTATILRLRPAQNLVLPLSRSYSEGPKGRLYLKSHEWAEFDGDVATVGISHFAQNELGEVVFIDLPEVGSTVESGKTFGVVESVKAASDVYAPVSGTVVDTNKELSASPGLVNSGPFTEGWMLKVKVDAHDKSHLLDEAAYEKHCHDH